MREVLETSKFFVGAQSFLTLCETWFRTRNGSEGLNDESKNGDAGDARLQADIAASRKIQDRTEHQPVTSYMGEVRSSHFRVFLWPVPCYFTDPCVEILSIRLLEREGTRIC